MIYKCKKKKSLKISINLICAWSCSVLLVTLIVFLTTVSSLWSALISFLHYRVVKSFKFLLFAFKFACFSIRIRWNPSLKFWNLAQNSSFLFFADLSLELFIVDCVFDIQAVAFKTVFGFNFSSNFLVLVFVFFSILDKLFNFIFWKSALVVGNCDSSILWCSLVGGCDIHDTILINFKGDLDLWNASWSWWDSVQIEASKLVVVFSHWSFPFEDLDANAWLIVRISRENLGFLCWDGCVSFNQFCHDSTCCFNSEWQWSYIQQDAWVNGFVSITF